MQRSWAIFSGHLPGISFLPIAGWTVQMLEQKQRDGEKGEVESQELLGRNAERVRVQVWHSALLTLLFTFSVNFLPSGFSLDLTDSVIPSQT